jgi:hypothetical protein
MKRRVQFLIQRVAGDQNAESALPSDLEQAHARSIRIDRDIACSGFHDSENARNRRGRFLEINPDAIARSDAVRYQQVGNLIAQFLQFSVSQRFIE